MVGYRSCFCFGVGQWCTHWLHCLPLNRELQEHAVIELSVCVDHVIKCDGAAVFSSPREPPFVCSCCWESLRPVCDWITKQWHQIAVAILSLQGAACYKTFSLAKSESCRNARGQCGVFTQFRCDVVANQCLSLWVSGWTSSMVLSLSKCRCLASVHTDGAMPILCFWRDFLWVYDRHYKAVGANNTVLHNGQWCIFRVIVVVVAKVLWVVARVRKASLCYSYP